MKDEFAFISNITPTQTYQQDLIKGIGDDAAVYRGSSEMDEVVCVDTMVEGIHFKRTTLSHDQLGKKALAVNISDLAAMGAIPRFYLVSIAIPPSWDEKEVQEIFRGMASLAYEYKMDLIGGDTVATETALTITVTVIGQVKKGQALYRHTAKPGDQLFVTGKVGTSAAGLSLLLENEHKKQYTSAECDLIRAHQEPIPHVLQGQLLATFNGRVSLNDVSDGIASEAYELAEASQVKIVLHANQIPFHPSMEGLSQKEKLSCALFGGEDYVLIGAVALEDFERLQCIFHEKKQAIYHIGTVEKGKASVFLKEEETLLKLRKNGYNHFQKSGESIE